MVRNTFLENPDREIEKYRERWVPKGRHEAWERYSRRAPDMTTAVQRCRQYGLAVQAGGNIGAWPVWLSYRFKEVLTFEPENMNFKCLVHNVESHKNIEPYNMALGDEHGYVQLKIAKSLGGHHLTKEPGTTPVVTLDSFDLEALDFLMLDIEGYEYEAIKGAINTIRKFKPIIQVEDRGHGTKKGNGFELPDILRLLENYGVVARVHRDVVLECTE